MVWWLARIFETRRQQDAPRWHVIQSVAMEVTASMSYEPWANFTRSRARPATTANP